MFSFYIISSFGYSERDHISRQHNESSLYSIKTYATYYEALKSAINRSLYAVTAQRIDEVDVSASETVNVANYGAKGDGSEATKVVLYK